jgi:hypothetical protein
MPVPPAGIDAHCTRSIPVAKYEVLTQTLGANPTYSQGDIIDDDGPAKAYDFAWLEEMGAVKKLSKRDLARREAPEEAPAEDKEPEPEGAPDMVVAPAERVVKPDDDQKPSARASHR